jgi:predicted ATP-binding protein involved in virulence
LDIMKLTHSWWEAPESAEGIVLVDELDAHLHPRWKMQVVSHLRAAFPRLQFLVSSHEPLTLRGLDKGEVVVLRRTPKDGVIGLTDLPSPKALRVDQLLTSEFFGMNSTIEPETERLFTEYYALLAMTGRSAPQTRRVAELKAALSQQGHLGQNRRERLMLEAADRYLAKERTIADPSDRAKLKARATGEIDRLWRDPTTLLDHKEKRK